MTKYRNVNCAETFCYSPAKSRGYCLQHYNKRYDQWRKSQVCNVPNCSKPITGRGMCSMHYYRVRKYGTTFLFVSPKTVSFCEHSTCTDLAIGQRSLCNAHYIEKRKKGFTTDKNTGVCQACGEPAVSGDRRYKFCEDCRPHWHQIKHGISGRQIESFIKSQNGLCAVCKRQRKLVVDHDHDCCQGHYSCGKCIRGLLCGPCNRGIGFLDDDATLALIAAYYLAQSKWPGTPRQITEQLVTRLHKLLPTHTDPAHLRMETATATERKNHV